jgi:ribonuclease Z
MYKLPPWRLYSVRKFACIKNLVRLRDSPGQCFSFSTLLQSEETTDTESSVMDDDTTDSKNLPDHWHINPALKDRIADGRNSLTPSKERTLINAHQGFSVNMLQTGAGKPSSERGCSASALRAGSSLFLIDAGEGTQMSLYSSRYDFSSLKKIFITHLHGDHIFGLPGLLLGLQLSAKHQLTNPDDNSRKNKSKEPFHIEIYGPVGLYNYIAMSLSLAMAQLMYGTVTVYELAGEARQFRHIGAERHYPEFQHRALVRKVLPRNSDGTWTISVAKEYETPFDANLAESERGLHIQAGQVYHVPKLQSFGYVIREPKSQPRTIVLERAKALGLEPSIKYRYLKAGFSVKNDNGSRTVHADDVCVGPPVKARSIAFLGDSERISPEMEKLCQNVDILVHEATYISDGMGLVEDARSASRAGHSSAADAGKFADKVSAGVVVLNHISSRYKSHKDLIVSEAERAIQGKTLVQLSEDNMELHVPRNGFHENSADNFNCDDAYVPPIRNGPERLTQLLTEFEEQYEADKSSSPGSKSNS